MKSTSGIIIIILLFSANIFTCFHGSIQAEEPSIIWSCTLNINESGGKQDTVIFGEASDATDGPPADSYDIVKPPTPMPPYVKAALNDNLPLPYDNLWMDYRQYPDSSKIWNLTVQWMPSGGSSSTNITLSWLPSELDESEYTSVHLCTDTGDILKNMLIENIYTFNCPAYLPQNFKIRCERTNAPPETPSIPSGDTIGYHGTVYTYSTSSTDPDGDDLYYQFDWGNTLLSSWFGPFRSGDTIESSYSWSAPGNYQIKVHTKDTYGAQSTWSPILVVEMTNRVPSQPSNPFPQQGATTVQTTPTLSWTGNDPDGDQVSFDVSFGTSNPPPKIIDNQSSLSFSPGTLYYQTTYYWRILSWDVYGGSTSGPVWSFTTQASENGSSEPPNGDENQTNQPPVADASFSEQTGFVGTMLVFNGSRSYDVDGYLTRWSWEFGDGTTGSGERTIHTYLTSGVYTVILTVTDDQGATGSDTISVQIGTANQPPTKPVINGTTIGTKNQTYMYTVYATDADNDFLQYIVSWGDGTQNTSMFLPNGTMWSLSHSWGASGKYEVLAKATDNISISEHTARDVFIDVTFINTLGFLFDRDNDGQGDAFYSNKTGVVTNAQRLANGSYLLDTDNDGKWNYQYDPTTGLLSSYQSTIATVENQWFFILIIVIAILIIAAIVYFYKKNYF